MERFTDKRWKNFDPWECCGQDRFCARGRHDLGGCAGGCIAPKLYAHLGAYEDTGLEPEEVSEYQHLCDSYAETGLDSKFVQFCIDATQNGLSMNRIRELAQAEKDGRLVVLPPNDPLTLEQLREMGGEPVWVCDPDGADGMWALVDLEHGLCRTAKGGIAIFDTYGKTWLAYRRKPEEGRP